MCLVYLTTKATVIVSQKSSDNQKLLQTNGLTTQSEIWNKNELLFLGIAKDIIRILCAFNCGELIHRVRCTKSGVGACMH